jgi:hypothetical protein
VEALEQLIEERAPGRVGKDRFGEASLERMALEEAPVEERYLAEGAGDGGALACRDVQRAEAEWFEDVTVERVAAAERCVEGRR